MAGLHRYQRKGTAIVIIGCVYLNAGGYMEGILRAVSQQEHECEPYQGLLELDTSWNNIKGRGAVLLFQALCLNNKIQVRYPPRIGMLVCLRCGSLRWQALDVSWNNMGSRFGLPDPIPELAKWITASASLVHLDFSHNQFTAHDVPILAEALLQNHTVLGLHCAGTVIACRGAG